MPFAFPASPDTGPGLTDAGRALVRACNELGILVDVSHLNERGLLGRRRDSERPIVATHSNAHALCASTRNLTDAQLDAVRDSGGVVGVNFAVTFLREDGLNESDETGSTRSSATSTTSPTGWGSTTSPSAPTSTAPSSRRRSAASTGCRGSSTRCASGYDATRSTKITHGNWLRVLDANSRGEAEQVTDCY